MKIWCIFKIYTAIKWRELLVVEQPSLLACFANNILGERPVGRRFFFVSDLDYNTAAQYSSPDVLRIRLARI